MKNKLLILFFVLLVCNSFTYAAVEWDTYWSNDFRQSVPVVGSLLNKNSPDKVLMLFYAVEDWEIKTCSQHVTTEAEGGKYNGKLPSDTQVWFDGSTIAVSASKYKYGNTNTTLYSTEWYVMPLRNKIKYTVYFKDKSGAITKVPGYENIEVGLEGASGLKYDYFEVDYTRIGINYVELDEYGDATSEPKKVETDIVIDLEAVYE